jgi:ketosteroid isomerase-like protein
MHTPDELREAVLAYYKALHEQDIDQLLSLYSDHGCSVADPVGTPPFEGKEQIRRLYKTAFAGYSPRVTADRFLFAPADNLAATQATGSMLSKKDGGRKIIRLNQEFSFDEQLKIRSMRAIWNPSDLSTPLRTVLITGAGSCLALRVRYLIVCLPS